MTNKEAIRRIKDHMVVHSLNEERAIKITEALQMAINALGSIEQIKWERDIAISQLEELGLGLGQIIEDMKKIYKIGTKQEFIYTTLKFFGKKIKTEKCWIIRNVKYIYANNQEDAKEIYMKWFFKEYKSIKGRDNWYLESDNVNIWMDEDSADITSTTVVLIDNDKDIDVK